MDSDDLEDMSTDDDDDAVASSLFCSVYALMRFVEEVEEDDEEVKARWGGSTPFKRKNVARDFEGAYNKLVE